MRALFVLVILCLVGSATYGQQGFDLKTIRKHYRDSLPAPVHWVNDFENLYSQDEAKVLNTTIGDFEKKTTNQICIVTLDTLLVAREDFDSLAIYIANRWGVGRKRKNNGITICICRGYRKMRICNGKGISRYLSDKDTQQIIDHDFSPFFRRNLYYDGTLHGLNAIIAKLSKQ